MIEIAIVLFILGLVALGISLSMDLKRYEALERAEDEAGLQKKVYETTEAPKRKRGRPRKNPVA